MTFAQVQGNDDVRRTLAAMVDAGKVPHAILFHEDDGGGAFPICTAFLQYLYCRHRSGGDSCGECPSCNKISKLIHPDVHIIFPTISSSGSGQPPASGSLVQISNFRKMALSNPYFTESDLMEAQGIEGKNPIIAVAESSVLLKDLSLSALEGGYRAVIIYLPERMNAEAANKLLKMIEEPPAMTQFLLITHSPERLLATISSRCQRIRILPRAAAAQVQFQDPSLLEDLMDALVSHNLLAALDASDKLAALPSRESAKAFCKFASDNLRQMFLAQQGLTGLGDVSDNAARWARSCPKSFPRKALDVLGRTSALIDRNVNLKILFTDMADKLYILL